MATVDDVWAYWHHEDELDRLARLWREAIYASRLKRAQPVHQPRMIEVPGPDDFPRNPTPDP